MAFQQTLDKLGLINSALSQTGDNIVNVADDGSDEWNSASPAYERGLAYIMESHNWGYAAVVATLQPSPTPPQDTDWDTAFPLPPDLVFLIWAKLNDNTNSATSPFLNQLALYGIMGTPTGPVLVVNAQGGPPPPQPPLTPAQCTIKYISNQGPLCDATNGTPSLILSLQTFVMSGIYRGLRQDTAEADKLWAAGKVLLQEARTRYDQQKPKRQFFNSRMTASRRIRRPWPQLGTGNWGSSSGGSGIPG